MSSAEESINPARVGLARVSPARWAAFRVLERVANTDAHADDLLHGALLRGISEADTSLAHALVMGVLRWQMALEAELLPLLANPDRELPPGVATALRMGAFQLRHMDRIPSHAALNESVALVKLAGQEYAAGMVNAVLRKVAGSPRTVRVPISESVEGMAARLGHPAWMVERWARAYGRAAAEAVCAYDLQEPRAGELFADKSVAMDDGSQLIAELAAACVPDAVRVWDACAAPGGKTMVLAERLPQAEIFATDLSPKRLARMRERVDGALPGRVRSMVADASKLGADEGPFDLILCDAPCSGTGTMARNPEIKTRVDEGDLPRQAARQQAILAGAFDKLRVGGRIVYSTCSLEREENEAVVEAVMAERGDMRVVPVVAPLQSLVDAGRMSRSDSAWVRGEFLRTLPGANFAGDGFFAAVLERIG